MSFENCIRFQRDTICEGGSSLKNDLNGPCVDAFAVSNMPHRIQVVHQSIKTTKKVMRFFFALWCAAFVCGTLFLSIFKTDDLRGLLFLLIFGICIEFLMWLFYKRELQGIHWYTEKELKDIRTAYQQDLDIQKKIDLIVNERYFGEHQRLQVEIDKARKELASLNSKSFEKQIQEDFEQKVFDRQVCL